MNTSKAKKVTKKAEQTEREYIELRSAEVKNVRVVEAKNGDLVGWSFGFCDRDVENKRDEDGFPLRDVKDLDLVEVSLLDRTKTPAYDGTLVCVRADENPIMYGEATEDEVNIRSEEEIPQEKPVEIIKDKNLDKYKQLVEDMKN